MIGNASMLKNICPYFGNDFVLIGNNSLLDIKSIGDARIKRGNQILSLKDVLHVPNLNSDIYFDGGGEFLNTRLSSHFQA